MKSVGEAMAIGRTFHESVQKALASHGNRPDRLRRDRDPRRARQGAVIKALSAQTPDRLRLIAQAMRHGLSDDEIAHATAYDPWFLARIREIVETEAEIRAEAACRSPPTACAAEDDGLHRRAARALTGATRRRCAAPAPPRRHRRVQAHRHLRRRVRGADPLHVFDLRGPAMGEVECEARPSDRKKVVILGGGPNRIGQGIEFDYCCCHACFALTDAGYETIMVNCNPETVSTDYDTSDRLYFEPLTLEHVLEILRVEQENGTLHGVIVQFGGQTPLKLANALEAEGIPILGTTPDAIDLAEDRERFQRCCNGWGLKQPVNGIAHSEAEAFEIAARSATRW
jgi:carbamoyl-phosphate synthase large subunit